MPRPIHIKNGMHHQAHVIDTVVVRMNHLPEGEELDAPLIARACEAFAEMLDLFEMGLSGGGFTGFHGPDDAQFHECGPEPWWTLEEAVFTDPLASV